MRVGWAVAALAPGKTQCENMASCPTDYVPLLSDGFSFSKQLEELEGSSQNVFFLIASHPFASDPRSHCIHVHTLLIQKVLVPSPAATARARFLCRGPG